MRLKEHSVLERSLASDASRYMTLAEVFAGFRSSARIAEKAEFKIKGISMANEGGRALLVDFAGIRVRFSFRFEREAGQGFLDADDVSDPAEPRSLWAVSFNGHGETNIERRDRFSEPFSLHKPEDCVDLVLAALDEALGPAPA